MRKDVIRTRRRRDTSFDVVGHLEGDHSDSTVGDLVLTDIKRKPDIEYEKDRPYKMTIDIGKEHPLVPRSGVMETHHYHHYHHHHMCEEPIVGHNSQMNDPGTVDNSYYCSYC